MSSGSSQRAGRVVVVSDPSTASSGAIAGALEAAGLDVIVLPDVYSAMGEIAAGPNAGPVSGVVVQADSGCLETSEAEFFALAGRLMQGGRVCVYAASHGQTDLVAAAVAAGASVLDAESLADWAHTLAMPTNPVSREGREAGDLPVAPTVSGAPVKPLSQDAGKAAAVGSAEALAERLVAVECKAVEIVAGGEEGGPAERGLAETEPEVSRDEAGAAEAAAEPVAEAQPEPLSLTVEPVMATAVASDEAVAEEPAADQTDVEPAPAPDSWEEEAAAPPEEPARPVQAPPVARPIALSEYRHPPAPRGDPESEPDAEGEPFVAVPWRPSPNRPARTPPHRRSDEPARDRGHDPEVELTQEELDALLGSNLDEPDSRRKPR